MGKEKEGGGEGGKSSFTKNTPGTKASSSTVPYRTIPHDAIAQRAPFLTIPHNNRHTSITRLTTPHHTIPFSIIPKPSHPVSNTW